MLGKVSLCGQGIQVVYIQSGCMGRPRVSSPPLLRSSLGDCETLELVHTSHQHLHSLYTCRGDGSPPHMAEERCLVWSLRVWEGGGPQYPENAAGFLELGTGFMGSMAPQAHLRPHSQASPTFKQPLTEQLIG